MAVVVSDTGGFPPNTANSFWIAPGKILATNQPVGNYDYQTTIDLTGLDPATASITGNVAADDSVTILLNGVKKATIPLPGWTALLPFTISGDFVPGINKLDFAVPNIGGPTGLHVQLSGTAAGASTAVSVSAQQPWVDTGVDLKAGEALTISANGQWTNGGNPQVFIGPDGYVGFRLPDATLGSANFAALIGKVGDQVFFVGSAYKGTSPGTGRLYLQMNDLANSFADNSGKLDVVVKRNQ